MKILRFEFLIGLLSLFLLSSCSSALNFLKYNVPKITDAEIFPADTVEKSTHPFSFAKVDNQDLPPAYLWAIGKNTNVRHNTSVEDFLDKNATTAFLVIRNDTVLYEKYFDGFSRDHYSQVFSVTKSVVSALVGIAISEGYIKSVDQPVSDFLPYFKDKGRDRITLHHLLQMTSGLAFSDYKNLGKLLNLYYTKDQESLVRRIGLRHEPGTHFAYKSIATQVLGMCLEKATGRRFADYLNEKLWEPLGMEHDATIALEDKGGDAKMYGGLTASAIDLAKLGRLYLNKGNWNGKQIIPEEWIDATISSDSTDGSSWRYSNCWWLDTYPRVVGYCENDFFAGGFRGQVIYVNPNDNTIIIRIGWRESGVEWPHSLSKLSLLNAEDAEDEHSLAKLEGKYKSESGKSFGVHWLNNLLVLEDFEVSKKVQLHKDTDISFVNPGKNLTVIVDYRGHEVKGLFVENNGEAMFIRKANPALSDFVGN